MIEVSTWFILRAKKVPLKKEETLLMQNVLVKKILGEYGMKDFIPTVCPMDPKLKLVKDKDKKLISYLDGNLTTDTMECKNINGMFFYLDKNFITWKSQRSVTLSSCDSEFMVATLTTCRVLWL